MKKIQILGTDCAKCRALTQAAENAAKAVGCEYTLERVTQIHEVMKYGVMVTPALVIDGQVKSSGTIPDARELQRMLS